MKHSKDWYELVPWDKGSKEVFKLSHLTQDEVYMVVDTISELRKKKYFWLADYLRDKVMEIGYNWEKGELHELLGRTRQKLQLGVDKKGNWLLKGYIHRYKDKPGLTTELYLLLKEKKWWQFWK